MCFYLLQLPKSPAQAMNIITFAYVIMLDFLLFEKSSEYFLCLVEVRFCFDEKTKKGLENYGKNYQGCPNFGISRRLGHPAVYFRFFSSENLVFHPEKGSNSTRFVFSDNLRIFRANFGRDISVFYPNKPESYAKNPKRVVFLY